MIPIRVYVEGFMCYREPAELNFNGAPLWMLTGKNGAGKSAFFDAITYALYGFHRLGDGENYSELINKNSSRMCVEFDFAVDKDLYRVKRTHQRKGNPTFQAYKFGGGYGVINNYAEHLQPIGGTDKEKGLSGWVSQTIGLDKKAFPASILLIQGKSDALLRAKVDERHKILKDIVDLSKYEKLHKRADDLRGDYRREAETLQKRLLNFPPVEAAQIEALSEEIAAATGEYEKSRGQFEELLELKGYAANWEKLVAEQAELENEIQVAQKLFKDKTGIEKDAAEAEELNQILPVLESLFDDRQRLNELNVKQDEYAELENRIADLQLILEEIETARQTFPHWHRYCEERRRWTEAIAEIKKLETELRNLGEDISGLESEESEKLEILEQAGQFRDEAREALTRAESRYESAVEKNERFLQLKGQSECDWCGQALTPEHRTTELAKLEKMLREAQAEREVADENFKQAREDYDTHKSEFDEILRQLSDLRSRKTRVEADLNSAGNSRTQALQIAAQSFSALPGTAKNKFDAPENIESCLEEVFPTDEDLKKLQSQTRLFDTRQKEMENLRSEQNKIASFLGQLDQLKATVARQESALSEKWREKSRSLTAAELKKLQARKSELTEARQKLSELHLAESAQISRKNRLEVVAIEIEATDEQARRPASEIESEINEFRRRKETAETRRRRAETEKINLENQQRQRAELEKEQREAQHKFALYQELARLLGRDFLQRQLLRDAETTIVAHANRFLDRVSSGTLRLALKDKKTEENSEAKAAKALDLVAYHEAAGQQELPVDALSGGQRFRVAVSLALGIGQYANSGTRRLESVIIDEGFGSLDRDGRSEMIAELHRLKEELQRIIVVSHQEEVADAFPNNKYLIEYLNGSSQVRLVDD